MGVIYAAYDEELDRRVAVKLLRSRNQGCAEAHTRMLREAQALARLSHPNVVQIYEVGEYHDQLYMAMEFVRGDDLRTWLHAARRSWLECCATYLAAGRGLAAAHAAGLVHRDFKPENVVMADDGRVKVLDFGLVTHASDNLEGDSVTPLSTSDSFDIRLTDAQTMLGTPAYMSPEQHMRAVVDARSDQFSFCVALWEAVYGIRPFAGDTAEAVARSVLRGQIAATPPDRRVPGWLRQVLLRGMSIDPSARFPTMQALLSELARDPWIWRRRVSFGLTSLAIVVGASWAGYRFAGPGVCAGGHAGLSAVWDDARREAVTMTMTASDRGYARDTAQRVVAVLDDYAESWAEQRMLACEDHHRGLQSAAIFDLRTMCLERRKREMQVLVEVLGQSGAAVLPRAIEAAQGLPSVASCQDVPMLMAARERVGKPATPALAAAIETVREELLRMQQALKFGQSIPASAMQAVLAAAQDSDYDPLLAEAELLAARVAEYRSDFHKAEAHAWTAWLAAERAGDLGRRAELALWMATTLGTRLARLDEGQRWSEVAEVLVGQLGDDPAMTSELELMRSALARERGDFASCEAFARRGLAASQRAFGRTHSRTAQAFNALAGALRGQGNWQEAVEVYAESLAIDEAVLGVDHPHTAAPINNIGNVYYGINRYAEALVYYQRALKIRRDAHGAWHADVAASLNNIANSLLALGQNQEALEHHGQALEIRERVFGPNHPDVANSLANMALVLRQLGQAQEEHAALHRALAIQERTLGRDHIDIAYTRNALGNNLFDAGDYEAAAAEYERAVTVTVVALGPDHPDVAVWQGNLGNTYLRLGQRERGKTTIEAAVALTERSLGPENLQLLDPLTVLARLALEAGDASQALVLAKRALALSGIEDLSPEALAELNFTLAQALATADHRQRVAAVKLADAAASAVRTSPKPQPELLASIEAWLARHPQR